MIPELLFLALDFYRQPRRFDQLRQPGGTLPPGMGELLAAPANCLNDDNIEITAVALGAEPEECRACVPFFIKQVLLEVPGDYYRVLGLQPGAEQAQVKEHYFYLMRLFHPDKDVNNEGWDDLYAPRINEAYNTLRNPRKRAEYDAAQAARRGEADGFSPEELARAAAAAPPTAAAAPAAARPAATDAGLRNATTTGRGGASTARSGSVFRSPWLYAVLGLFAVLLLFGLLYKSNQTSQLTVSANGGDKPAAARSFDSIEQVQALNEQGEPAEQTVAPATAPASQDTGAAGMDEDERIEALVQARVDKATRAVLGAPRPKVKAKPRPAPKPVVKSKPVAKPEPAAVVEPVARPAVEPEIAASVAEPQVAAIEVEPTAPDPEPAAAEPASAALVAESTPEPEPEPAPSSEPEPEPAPEPEPEPAPIEDDELDRLLMAFASAYENRNAEDFANLFAPDAETTDASGKTDIHDLYSDFFADIDVKSVRFKRVRWQRGTLQREGEARVVITTAPMAGGETSAVEARIKFQVRRAKRGDIEISRMTY